MDKGAERGEGDCMRRQSRVQRKVRGITIGGENALVCLPLMVVERDQLVQQAKELVALRPDMLEWRVDALKGVTGKVVASLVPELRRVIGQLPLLFTCRIDSEGGMQPLTQEKRLEIFAAALAGGEIDLVDVELCNGKEFIDQVRAWTQAKGCGLLLSHHDFRATPDAEQLLATFVAAQAAGADIAKLAVMPQSSSDVLSLLTACDRARQGAVDIPLIAISMGEMGVISRVAGALFGSDITFAAGSEVSAPGQLPIEEMRRAMAVILGPAV
jgi:3-dehydroquinate dehydratase I